MTTLYTTESIGRAALWRAFRFAVVALILACCALTPASRALLPPQAPDGVYPNQNTAEGEDALFSLTTGDRNTAIGFEALHDKNTGFHNTAVGAVALHHNTTGNRNTAAGVNALFSNTTGQANRANGSGALRNNTTADFNTAVGTQALINNIRGNFNTATGVNALFSNDTGRNNIATGFETLVGNNAAMAFAPAASPSQADSNEQIQRAATGQAVRWADTVLGAAPPATRTGVLATKRSSDLGRAIIVIAKGCVTEGDGGGGVFYWATNDTTPDNGGTVIVPTGAFQGCWKRLHDGLPYGGRLSAHWFGAKGDGVADDTDALRAWLAASIDTCVAYLPRGKYRITDTLTINGYQSVEGDGSRSAIWVDVGTSKTGVVIGGIQNQMRDRTLRNFSIQGGPNACQYAVEFIGVYRSVIENVSVGCGCAKHAVVMGRSAPMIENRININVSSLNTGSEYYGGIGGWEGAGILIDDANGGFFNANHCRFSVEGGEKQGGLYVKGSIGGDNSHYEGTFEGAFTVGGSSELGAGYGLYITGCAFFDLGLVHVEGAEKGIKLDTCRNFSAVSLADYTSPGASPLELHHCKDFGITAIGTNAGLLITGSSWRGQILGGFAPSVTMDPSVHDITVSYGMPGEPWP